MPLLVRGRSVLAPRNDQPTSLDPNEPGSPFLTPSSTIARPVSEGGPPLHSRLSHELHPDDIDISGNATDGEGDEGGGGKRRNKRFSLMRLTRNYSEGQLHARAKMDAERERGLGQDSPPVPAIMGEGFEVPQIVKTAPTTMDAIAPDAKGQDDNAEVKKARPSIFSRASSKARTSEHKERPSTEQPRAAKKAGSSLRWRRTKTSGLEDLHRLSTMHIADKHHTSAPPSYGDEQNSTLAVPVLHLADPRASESSRSDGSNDSSGEIYGSTTTTTHTVSTHTTFFRIPRRNKNRNSLFPIPIKIPPPHDDQQRIEGPATPRASTQSAASSPDAPSTSSTAGPERPNGSGLRRAHTEANAARNRSHSTMSSPSVALAKSSLSFAEPGMNLFRHNSRRSQSSNPPSSPLQPPARLGLRDRSSTVSSWGGRSSRDGETPPPLSASGRNSTSTMGRSSLGGLLTLSRFRQSSEPHSPRNGSPGTMSKSDSFAMSREALVIPEREDGDTPGKYLERLESAVSRSVIAGILSKSADTFAQAVLRSYTRRFPFFTEPIDMSLRKFLLEAELPKETQQVDRVVQAFADRYHECNPGIFTGSDSAYVVAFSIMMLHTDAFNKNNKRKMQKQDYLKNTAGQGVSDDILACIYDNICYTPFIHYDEDVDVNGERIILPFKTKKTSGKLKSAIPGADAVKKPSGPVDPYNLIVENKLDILRPTIGDSILMDDPYDYRGTHGELEPTYLQRAFTHTGIIQIISARSRPAAYENQYVEGQQPNPTDSQQGIVDLKITKVGLLWRKSSKKKKTRSPWQEWGAMLTGTQLYLFKNSHWAKGLMNQFHNAQRPGQPRTPVTFKPPLQDFKPDALIKTDNAVALVDSTYNRHKNAFTFVRPGGLEEVFLADNEHELNDWLGLINYAAAFRAAGVRIRGMVGGNEEDQRVKEVERLASTKSMKSTQMPDITLQNRGMSPQLQRQVMAARRQIMVHKIGELEKEIVEANRQLENMLRNGRHILVLAPISPRTREEVIQAAIRADTMIKWLRRDIWRMKCHRDILALDVRIDGLSASELEKLTQNQQRNEQESAKKDKPKILTRLSSAKSARSPPQSPVAHITPGRPSTRDSIEKTISGFSADVFRTPPESASPAREEGWRLPPLNLDSGAHRPSITSTFLSTEPTESHASLSHSASSSSIVQAERTLSYNPSEPDGTRDPNTPAGNVDERRLQLLARTTRTPDADGANDGLHFGTSPESSKHKGVRRSLHKTLRDHHHHGSAHKHRRNKDSDSTVRSVGGDDKDAEVLARDKPRFILHGKQASVVQFGGDWERMKLRREQYGNQNPSSPTQAQRDAVFERNRSEQHELVRAGMASPLVQNLRRGSQNTDDDDNDNMSVLSEGSDSFRNDAEAAAAWTAYNSSPPSGSPALVSSSGDTSDVPEFPDIAAWNSDGDRRTTVIGPSTSKPSPQSGALKRHRRYSSLQKSSDGTIEHVEEGEEETDQFSDAQEHTMGVPTTPTRDRENRRTVIGPSSTTIPARRTSSATTAESLIGKTSSGRAATTSPSNNMTVDGETDSDDNSGDEQGLFSDPMSEEELQAMSSGLGATSTIIKPLIH